MLESKAKEQALAVAKPARARVEAPPAEPTAALRALADLIEQVNRVVFALGFSGGLNPAQWAALRYLSRSAEARCTVGGLAEFQGVTAPTASETISALVRKGLVERRPSLGDRRSHLLAATDTGRVLLRDDPLREVAGALSELSEQRRVALAEALAGLLKHLLERRAALRDRS